MIEIEGYVIVAPVSPWYEKDRDRIIADTSYRTFDTSPYAAWMRQLGGWRSEVDKLDTSRRIQFYFDRGYRVKKAKMIIDETNESWVDEEKEDNDEFAEGSEAFKLLQEMADEHE